MGGVIQSEVVYNGICVKIVKSKNKKKSKIKDKNSAVI